LGRLSARSDSCARLRRSHTCRQIIVLVETHASNIDKLLEPRPRRTSCMSIDIEVYPAKYQVGCSINHPHELVSSSIGAHTSPQSPRQIAFKPPMSITQDYRETSVIPRGASIATAVAEDIRCRVRLLRSSYPSEDALWGKVETTAGQLLMSCSLQISCMHSWKRSHNMLPSLSVHLAFLLDLVE
jgi:hypothetical protein